MKQSKYNCTSKQEWLVKTGNGTYRISKYGTIIIECTARYGLTTPLHSLPNILKSCEHMTITTNTSKE